MRNRHQVKSNLPWRAILPATAFLLMSACMVGPKYVTPAAPFPGTYSGSLPDSYQGTQGWKVAQPKDEALRSKLWEIFNDPQLKAPVDGTYPSFPDRCLSGRLGRGGGGGGAAGPMVLVAFTAVLGPGLPA